MSQAPFYVRNIRFGTTFGSDLKVGTIKIFKDYFLCYCTIISITAFWGREKILNQFC